MSWTSVAWAKNQRVGSPTRKLILIALAECADERGRCWPSYGYVAQIAECSTKSVERHLERLEAMALLSRTHRLRRGDGRMGAYHYQLNVAQVRMALGEVDEPTDNLSSGQSVGWGDQPTPVSDPADTAVSAGPADTGVGAGTDHYGTTKEPTTSPRAPAREAPVDNSEARTLEWRGCRYDLRAAPDDLTDDALVHLLERRRDHRQDCSLFVVAGIVRELARASAEGTPADEAIRIWLEAGWSTFRADYLRRMRDEASVAAAAGPDDAELDRQWQQVVELADRGAGAGDLASLDKRLSGPVSALGGLSHIAALGAEGREQARQRFHELRREEAGRKAVAG